MVIRKGLLPILCSLVVNSTVFQVNAEESKIDLNDIEISGFLDTSANWDSGSGSGPIPGRSFDGVDKADGFNLNVFQLSLGKSLTEDEYAAGFHADLLFGPDANLYGTTSTGKNDSDFAIRQAYVNGKIPVGNGVEWKLGVFDTLIGYEVFPSKDNPNYSRSYAYFIEPFAQTGAAANYAFNDTVAVNLAVANVWNTKINARPTVDHPRVAEGQKTYLGNVVLTAPEELGCLEGASLTFGTSQGYDSSDTFDKATSYYVGGTTPTPFDSLKLGVAYDYRRYELLEGNLGRHANTLGLYALLKVTDKFSLNGRTEYARGASGMWTLSTPEGQREELLGLTVTGQYDIWENLLTRAEVRWDRDLSGGPGVFNNPGSLGSSPDNDNLSGTLNFVFSF
jgi:hypothetical protein